MLKLAAGPGEGRKTLRAVPIYPSQIIQPPDTASCTEIGQP